MMRIIGLLALLILPGLAQEKIVVKQNPRQLINKQWEFSQSVDEVENKSHRTWTVRAEQNPKLSVSIYDCKDVIFVTTNEVLDKEGNSITVKYRTVDMVQPEATEGISTLHGTMWDLADAIKSFWRNKPSFGNELFVNVPSYPESTIRAHFFLPPVPHECR